MDRIETLKEFLKQDPTDSFLKHALALEYMKAGDDSTAQKLFEEICKRIPGILAAIITSLNYLNVTATQQQP